MLEISSSRRVVFLFLSFLVALGIGVFFSLSLNKSLEEEAGKESTPSDAQSVQDEDEHQLPKGWVSLQGVVFPVNDVSFEKSSHKLVDENGEVVMLLTASDEKLLLAEGMEVEVQGPLEFSEASGDDVMRVETVLWEK